MTDNRELARLRAEVARLREARDHVAWCDGYFEKNPLRELLGRIDAALKEGEG